MKKGLLFALAALMLLTFAACGGPKTVATMETSSGGEVELATTDAGEAEVTVSGHTATADYEELLLTYTDPEGYSRTEEAGGVVTYSLDGHEMSKIVYMPAVVEAAAMDEYWAAVEAGGEELNTYAAQYAQDLNADFTAKETTINGRQALLITGTVAPNSALGTEGAEGMILVIPMGNQLVTIKGVADTATAEQVKADFNAFAESLQGEAVTSASSSMTAASSSAA